MVIKMKQKQPVKAGIYTKLCFLLICLAMLTTGCMQNINSGGIDPNAVEHNPNQQVGQPADGAVGTEDTEGLPQSDTTLVPEEPEPSGGQEVEKDEVSDSDEVQNVSDSEGGITDIIVEPEYTVVLDPGHGGAFTGAVYGELVEKDTALKIALYAKEYLEKNYPQIEVKMTREADKDFDTALAKDLENRVQLGKDLGADIFVSFHLNASAAHNIRGAEVICPHREPVKEDSFLLANSILDELTALGIKRRGIVTKNSNDTVDANGNPVEYYAINRHAANRNMVGIIIEHCFMDNEEDKQYLADDEALKRLGEADARGIAAYFGY